MRVRYHPAVGAGMLVLGGICLVFGLTMPGDFTSAVWLGAIAMIFGPLYLTQPYFFVHSASVERPALIGPVKRNFPFRSLEVERGRLIAIGHDGTRKKVPVALWFAHSADWQAVTSGVRG